MRAAERDPCTALPEPASARGPAMKLGTAQLNKNAKRKGSAHLKDERGTAHLKDETNACSTAGRAGCRPCRSALVEVRSRSCRPPLLRGTAQEDGGNTRVKMSLEVKVKSTVVCSAHSLMGNKNSTQAEGYRHVCQSSEG